jgi:DNA (cytosine-5)-methyltransferase 1
LEWDPPAPTITSQLYSYGTGRFGHPSQNRAITIREAAILQTFPETFKFYENEEDIPSKNLSAYIGNAVPVKLAFIIGKSIMIHIEVHNGRE